MTDYATMPFDELKKMHKEIGTLLAQRRHEELEDLRARATLLGFTADDLVPKKLKKGSGQRKYQDPENSENIWFGKGRKPAWLADALEAGAQLEEFAVA